MKTGGGGRLRIMGGAEAEEGLLFVLLSSAVGFEGEGLASMGFVVAGLETGGVGFGGEAWTLFIRRGAVDGVQPSRVIVSGDSADAGGELVVVVEVFGFGDMADGAGVGFGFEDIRFRSLASLS